MIALIAQQPVLLHFGKLCTKGTAVYAQIVRQLLAVVGNVKGIAAPLLGKTLYTSPKRKTLLALHRIVIICLSLLKMFLSSIFGHTSFLVMASLIFSSAHTAPPAEIGL